MSGAALRDGPVGNRQRTPGDPVVSAVLPSPSAKKDNAETGPRHCHVRLWPKFAHYLTLSTESHRVPLSLDRPRAMARTLLGSIQAARQRLPEWLRSDDCKR